ALFLLQSKYGFKKNDPTQPDPVLVIPNKIKYGFKQASISTLGKISISAIGPSASQIPHTPLGSCLEDIKVKGETFTLPKNKSSTIQFNPVVKKGIVRFEVRNINRLEGVGIADESIQFDGEDQFPTSLFDTLNVGYYYSGQIGHLIAMLQINAGFENGGERIAMELNMDASPRTLTFFVNDVEQPNYITKIPAAVRFWVHIWIKDQSFEVLKFEELQAPTAKHAFGSRAWEFGTEWDKDE
ncbi:MAG: hypothetical protein EZS28_015853, partial [Streblomastix strix]